MINLFVLTAIFFMIIGSIVLLIGRFKSWLYVLFLILIASFLVLYPQIISPYVVGLDAHVELEMAKLTLNTGLWDPNLEGNVVNAALSIAIFAPSVSLISSVNINMVIKIIFCIFPIISIFVLWLFNKRIFHFSDKESYLSILLLVGTSGFMLISVISRQAIALFVSLLFLYIMIIKKLSIDIKIIMLFFIIGIIFSHYTTALIFVTFFSISSLIMKGLKKQKDKMDLVILSVVLIVFWLIYIVYQTSVLIQRNIYNIFEAIINFSTDKTSIVVQQQLNPSFSDLFLYLNYVVNILIILFLFIGIIFTLYKDTQKKEKMSNNWNNYCILSFLFIIFIFISLLPGISIAYNVERIYLNALFLCGGFAIFGWITSYKEIEKCSKKILKGRYSLNITSKKIIILLSIFVLLHLILQTGVLSKVVYDNNTSKYFNDIEKDRHYTFSEELIGINWLKDHKNKEDSLFTDYYGFGSLRLRAYGMFKFTEIIVKREIKSNYIGNGLFYQQKLNMIKDNTLFVQEDNKNINTILDFLLNQNKVYTSGNTNVYYL